MVLKLVKIQLPSKKVACSANLKKRILSSRAEMSGFFCEIESGKAKSENKMQKQPGKIEIESEKAKSEIKYTNSQAREKSKVKKRKAKIKYTNSHESRKIKNACFQIDY